MKKLFSHKNKVLAGCFLIATSTLVSCKKLIGIPPNPPTQITRQQEFSDSASTMSAVAGVYTFTGLTNGGGIPYSSGNFDAATALSAHEVAYTASYGDYTQFSAYTVAPGNNGEIDALWTGPYAEIYQVNDILAGITNNSALSAPLVKQLTGEMEVVRAYVYFNLLNLFGDAASGGVPIVINTDYATNAQLPRATQAAVYAQILTDLNNATTKLTSTYSSSGHYRPNLYTAVALKAKVNLYMGNFTAAQREADSVITYGGFGALPALGSVFADGSSEAIWQVPVSGQYQGSGDAQQFVPYTGSQPSYAVTDSLLNRFEKGDQRKLVYMDSTLIGGKQIYYPFKYQDKNATPGTDFMLLRLADMYLIRAEAAAENGSSVNLGIAIADVNTIRNRAGLANTKVTTTSPIADILAVIAKERRLELCFELGNRWFDLNRTANDTKYPKWEQAPAVLAGWTPNFAVYPISNTEISLNSHLKQNQGYH